MRSFISERAPLSPRMSSEGVFRVGTKRNGVVFDQGRGLVMITWEELRRRACSCDMQVEKEWEFYKYELNTKWIGAWMSGNVFDNTDMKTGNAK
jgi:hypothetical protein